jgi:hypothetical protein
VVSEKKHFETFFPRETGNIRYTRQKKKKHKTNQRNWQHRVHKTKKNKTKTIQRNWQHRVHKTKTNKTQHNPEKLAT